MRSGCRVMVLAISREPAEVQGLPSAEFQGLPPPTHPPSAEVQAHPPHHHAHVYCSSMKSDNLCTALAGLSLLIIRLVIYILKKKFIISYPLSRLLRREAALVPATFPSTQRLLAGRPFTVSAGVAAPIDGADAS